MSTDHSSTTIESDGRTESEVAVPAVVDWAIGAFAALVGTLLALGGGLAYWWLDSETVQLVGAVPAVATDFLTEAELLRVARSVAEWTSFGLVACGLCLVLGGARFVYGRRRTRRDATPEGESTGTTGAHAVYGAATTVLFAAVPFSGVAGGAVAAWLEPSDRSHTRVGALSGLLGVAPGLVVLAGTAVGAVVGCGAIGAPVLGLAVGGLGGAVLLVVGAVGAGLGALGGVVANHLR
jgi:hypothetical protein